MPFLIKKKERPTSNSGKNEKPTIIRWKGTDMIRAHSIVAVADEIVQAIQGQDMISINIIGKQSTGKTTIAETISHLVHEMSEFPFKVNFLGKKEILDLEHTVSELTPTNQIIVFDDMSFLGANATSKQIKVIESILSTIRHLPGGKDVRIILIKNMHYTKSISPFLRQNDFTFISSVDPNEIKNLKEVLGDVNGSKVDQLLNLRAEALLEHKFTIRLGKKWKFTYLAKNPFLPYLYSNGRTIRLIVSPKREWLDKICVICATALHQESKIDVVQFKEEFDAAFPNISKSVIKQLLKEQGIDSYSKPVVACRRYLERGLDMKQFNLEDIAIVYGLKKTKTRLNKKPEGVLVEPSP